MHSPTYGKIKTRLTMWPSNQPLASFSPHPGYDQCQTSPLLNIQFDHRVFGVLYQAAAMTKVNANAEGMGVKTLKFRQGRSAKNCDLGSGLW